MLQVKELPGMLYSIALGYGKWTTVQSHLDGEATNLANELVESDHRYKTLAEESFDKIFPGESFNPKDDGDIMPYAYTVVLPDLARDKVKVNALAREYDTASKKYEELVGSLKRKLSHEELKTYSWEHLV